MTSDQRLRQPYQGQLSKYTNVVKGWQYRWFVIVPEIGTLEYFVTDTDRKLRPRGSVHLGGAVISPSDEDSHTFTVNPATGEVYKLRATDAKERQEWVTRLRAVAELHTQVQNIPRDLGATTPNSLSCQSRMPRSLSVLDAFSSVHGYLQRCEHHHYALCRTIEELPSTGSGVKCTDTDILTLKAISQATLVCLEQCLYVLQHQQAPASNSLSSCDQSEAQARTPVSSSHSVANSVLTPSTEP